MPAPHSKNLLTKARGLRVIAVGLVAIMMGLGQVIFTPDEGGIWSPEETPHVWPWNPS